MNVTWTRRDLNPGPPPCEGGALPTEPRALFTLGYVIIKKIE